MLWNTCEKELIVFMKRNVLHSSLAALLLAPALTLTLLLGAALRLQAPVYSPKTVFTKLYINSTGTNAVLLTLLGAVSGTTYQFRYTTDLRQSNWATLGSPKSTTNGVITMMDAIGTNQQRFYEAVQVN